MPRNTRVDPAELRAAIAAIGPWLDDPDLPRPPRGELANAVRGAARTLELLAPGHSVEVRIPPLAAVQCIAGPRHTRGTPPNVVQMSPRVWLELVTGMRTFDQAVDDGDVDASGSRAGEIAHWLPLLPRHGQD